MNTDGEEEAETLERGWKDKLRSPGSPGDPRS